MLIPRCTGGREEEDEGVHYEQDEGSNVRSSEEREGAYRDIETERNREEKETREESGGVCRTPLLLLMVRPPEEGSAWPLPLLLGS